MRFISLIKFVEDFRNMKIFWNILRIDFQHLGQMLYFLKLGVSFFVFCFFLFVFFFLFVDYP